jgi:putative ABC transport system substrate-binding protein
MRFGTVGTIVALAIAPLVAAFAADAESLAKVPRIGILWFGSPAAAPSPHLDAFRQGLREFGYVEGRNIVLESRSSTRRLDLLPGLAANLVHLGVDLIVAAGDPAVHAVESATRAVPIVMVGSADPLGSGFIASLARPGGNITGLSTLSPELSGKRLVLLREVLPGISRLAVLLNPADPAKTLDVRELQSAARALGLHLQTLEVRGPGDFEAAFARMTEERVEALMALGDPLTVTYRIQIVDLAARSRLPAIYDLREFVDAGGLMSYGPSLPELFRRAAAYVDKILKGAKPADLPLEQPTKFELAVNLKAAEALGLTIPPLFLFQADEVIR